MSGVDASRSRLRVATGVWFAVLLVCLLATDMIATLDPRIIAVLIVVSATVLFTSMQVIVREMSAQKHMPHVSPTRGKRVLDMAALNLVASASIYAILWSAGALPF